MRNRIVRAFGVGMVALLAGLAAGQDVGRDVVVVQKANPGLKEMNVAAFAPQGGTFTFIGTHAGIEGKVVKGVPFSAEGVTETERTLADGTKITKKTTSKIYRDSQGRTRREMTLGAVGPWVAEGESATTITIHDPVAGRMYVMHEGGEQAKTIDILQPRHDVEITTLRKGDGAHVTQEIEISQSKSSERTEESSTRRVWVGKGEDSAVSLHDFSGATGKGMVFTGAKEEQREDLGVRTIEGVLAKGTRTTRTIPEGKIGNDRPITVTTESWYSDELGITVMKKTNDPLSGNVTYKLTNISRAEPDPSLFETDIGVEVDQGALMEKHIRIDRGQKQPEEI